MPRFLRERGRFFLAGLPVSHRAKAQRGQWEVSSRTDADLAIDHFYLPPTGTPKNLIVVTSGVHGVEGFVGNAVQQLLLREILPHVNLTHTGIYFVHGINPWGMKHRRRVTENRIDLSRNFDINEHLFDTVNEPYRALNGLLNPNYPMGDNNIAHFSFLISALARMSRRPMRDLRQAILQGQYEFKNGIYYGGRQFEPQVELMKNALEARSAEYDRVQLFDIHTGFGRRGALHYLANDVQDPLVNSDIHQVYAGFEVSPPNSDDFYKTHGDFTDFATRVLRAQDKRVVPMILEYGTLDNQGKLASIDSLWRLVAENQLVVHETTSSSALRVIPVQFLELFYPRSRAWRERILETTARELPVLIDRFINFEATCADGLGRAGA